MLLVKEPDSDMDGLSNKVNYLLWFWDRVEIVPIPAFIMTEA